MAYKIILDAGHGGNDPGANYNGRNEKDDTLRLALAVGALLQKAGVNVEYIRTMDVYESPVMKADKANKIGGDYFISFHRNASGTPGGARGIEALLYKDTGTKATMARNILNNLTTLGYVNRGIKERPNLTVLKRTKMPAILLEVGFIDNDADNDLYDRALNAMAEAIAFGILDTLKINTAVDTPMYKIQVSAFSKEQNAINLVRKLKTAGYPAFYIYNNNLYKVRVGSYENLSDAVAVENSLRDLGYSTFITT